MTFRNSRTHLPILALFFVLSTAASAIACECRPWRVVESEFERHPTVVIAEIRTVRQIKKKGVVEVSIFTVTRSLKGKFKPGHKLTFKKQTSQDCTVSFTREPSGEQFLLYLDKQTIKSGPSTCSRSGRMSNAHSDVERIEEVLAGKSRW